MYELLTSPRLLTLVILAFSVIALLCAGAYATERKKRRIRAEQAHTQAFTSLIKKRRPAHVFRTLGN